MPDFLSIVIKAALLAMKTTNKNHLQNHAEARRSSSCCVRVYMYHVMVVLNGNTNLSKIK